MNSKPTLTSKTSNAKMSLLDIILSKMNKLRSAKPDMIAKEIALGKDVNQLKSSVEAESLPISKPKPVTPEPEKRAPPTEAKEGTSTEIGLLAPDQVRRSLVNFTSGPNGCMGRNSCLQQPAFLLSCPHKKVVRQVCSKCLIRIPDKDKCGCDDEDVDMIRPDLIEIYD